MKLRAAVLTVLAGAAVAVPAAPAAAAACSQGAGVTVVVEFASLGGGTQTDCASGNPSSGLAALRGTGHTPTRAAQEPGYFLCRIDGKPANDPCQRTSPSNAYWSYWHAKPGGTWTYSELGPADYDPAPGTVEGWAFGAGKPPSSPPPRPAQPSPTPAASRPAASPARSSAAPSPAAVSSASPLARPPTASAAPVVSSSPSPAAAASAAVSPQPTSQATPAGPSRDPDSVDKTFTTRAVFVPWSVLAGGLLLLLLLAATAWQVVRRRRTGGG
jgi:hypothetical protein